MNIIDTSPSRIMELFQAAYYDQIGRKMIIGSEEYTLSSIFSYVLSAHAAMINASSRNRFLSTAQGEFLDKIAERYNLSRNPVKFSNPYFDGVFTFLEQDGYVYDAGALSLEIAGHIYRNSKRIVRSSTPSVARFVCDEDHSEALNSKEITDSIMSIDLFSEVSMIDGLQAVTAPFTDDDEFRSYIMENMRLYDVGIAESFESVAKLSSKHIVDAHTIRQGEQGYIEGNVLVVVKPSAEYVSGNGSGIFSIDISEALNAIESMNITAIGTRSVSVSEANRLNRYVNVGTLYISKSYSSVEALFMTQLKATAIKNYLNNTIKIGEIVYTHAISELFKKPLNEISNDTELFGLTEEEYASVKEFVILGAGGTSSGAINPNENGVNYVSIIDLVYSIDLI